jgi:hypothetical protein
VDTASPEGKRLIETCSGGCTIEGTIVERERGEWVLSAMQRATPAPAARPLDVDGRDPRRKALLDALRPVIEQDLGQSVQFVVETLRERDGSAFAAVHPRTPQGRPIDFAKTSHAQRLADGALDGDTVFALLQYRDGRWQVREYAVAPTDVAWTGWAESYGAPDAIFVGADR